MLCRTAQRRLLDRQLGLSVDPVDPALTRHLAECNECALEARAGARIARDLAALRSGPPFAVDVVERVRAGLSPISPPRGIVSVPMNRPFVVWVAASLASIFLALVWGMYHLPVLAEGTKQIWTITSIVGRTAVHLVSAAGQALGITGAVAARWGVSWTSGNLGRMPFGLSIQAVALGALLVTISITALALARDFRRAPILSTKRTRT